MQKSLEESIRHAQTNELEKKAFPPLNASP